MSDKSFWPNDYWPDESAYVPDPTASVRQQIIGAVAARLAEITRLNGYRTDAGIDVHEWDVTPLDRGESTLRLEYRDSEGSTEWMAMGMQVHHLPITMRVLCSDNDAGESLTTVRSALADIYEAMFEDFTFGGLAEDTIQVGDARFDYGERADRAAGCEVTYVIDYTTVPGTP
jgi:hypothetical protein